MSARPYPPLALAFTVWGLGAILYFVGFFHRVAPAVITRELTEEFSLSAAALGNLSAVYFYSYVAMQIPTGLAADHWGPRKVLAAGAAVAAAGALLFAVATAYPVVALGRLLIGAAVGVAFVSMIKLSTHWFAPSKFAAMAGVALAAGVVGAVSAGAPLRWLVDAFGWRMVMIGASAVTGLLAVAIWIVVRDDPTERGYASYMPQAPEGAVRHSVLSSIAAVLKVPNVWLIFFINGGISGPALTFAGLWGVPFLVMHYGLSTAAAAAICSLLLLSWALAGPFAGTLSDRLRERKSLLGLGAGLVTAGWFLIFFVPGWPLAVLIALLVSTGIASSVVLIGFAFAKESTPSPLGGTTGGVINMGNMMGGMIMQPAVGWVLDRMWQGGMANGVRFYTFESFRVGFSLMLAWLVVAVILVLFTRETHCRQTR